MSMDFVEKPGKFCKEKETENRRGAKRNGEFQSAEDFMGKKGEKERKFPVKWSPSVPKAGYPFPPGRWKPGK